LTCCFYSRPHFVPNSTPNLFTTHLYTLLITHYSSSTLSPHMAESSKARTLRSQNKKSKPKQTVEADPPPPPVDQAPSPALSLHTVADDDIDMSDLSQVPPMLDPNSSSPSDWEVKVPEVIRVFNQPGGAIGSDDLLFRFARRLAENLGTKSDKMDVIVQRKLVASPDDEWELEKLITRTFEGARPPNFQIITSSTVDMRIVGRTGKAVKGTLMKSSEAVWRTLANRSFIWISPLYAVWPPALSLGPENGHSALWHFSLQKDFVDKAQVVLNGLVNQLVGNGQLRGAFFCAISKEGVVIKGSWYLRLQDADGNPIASPDVITEWLKEKTSNWIIKDSVWYALRCAICWQGHPCTKVKDHAAIKCPLLAAFNKLRAHGHFKPIEFDGNGGLSVSCTKEPVKVEKVAKDLDKLAKDTRGQISALDKRIVILEKKAGIKRKQDDSRNDSGEGSSQQPANKKNKGNQSQGQGNKAQGGNSGGKPSGSQQTQSGGAKQSEKGKGKQKAN
ncbi:hypothetical protein B0F90DRAFT_1868850, partial [Multifurca ochricompacta]